MTVNEFCRILEAHPGTRMHWMLPDRSFVAAHFHVTEVGRVRKDSIDCGGTVRSTPSCGLQIRVADDLDHRLETTKLATIMRVARPLLDSADNPVEVECEEGVISQYPIGSAEQTPSGLLVALGTTHTACLAPDKCGVGGTGCC